MRLCARLLAVALTAASVSLPSRPDAAPGPVATVRKYLDSIAQRRCDRAVALSTGYSRVRCRQTTRLRTHRVEQQQAGDDVSVVRVDTDYDKGSTHVRFVGYVTVRKTGESWRLDATTFRRAAGAPLERYRVTVARLPPPSRPPVRTATSPPPAPAGHEPSLHVTVGSAAVLQALWTPEALAGQPGDARVTRLRDRDGTPPAVEAPSRPPLPVPPGLRNSIRSVRLPRDEPLVALTFDLCERADDRTGYDAAIVDFLRAERVPATFFAGGKWMRSHPERAMQLIADPLFEVGNHGWTHGNLRVLTGAVMEDQILWTQAEYEQLRQQLAARARARGVSETEIDQVPPLPFVFRFPYGACSPESLATTARLGLTAVQWTLVSGDAAPTKSAAMLVRTTLEGARPGAIVIMHANGRGHGTAQAVPEIVRGLRQRGFRFVTVSDLLRAGTPEASAECYEVKPGDNQRYDSLFGAGTG